MATQVQNDLAKIKENIDLQLAGLRGLADQHRAKMNDLSGQLSVIQDQKHLHQITVQEARTHIDRATSVLLSKQEALKHAVGTSVETMASEALALVQADMDKHQKIHADVSELLAASNEQEAVVNSLLAEAEAAMAEVVSDYNKADTQRKEFNQQHANEARRVALFRLHKATEGVAEAEKALEAARVKRAEAQKTLSADMAEWPELAYKTMLEYGVFPPHSVEALLVMKRNLIEAIEDHRQDIGPVAASLLSKDIPVHHIIGWGGVKEARATLVRRKARGEMFVGLDPMAATLELHVNELNRVIEEIHQQHVDASAKATVDSQKA